MQIKLTQIAAPQRHAMTVKEFENLDRDLPPIVHAIAELRRLKPTAIRIPRDIKHDPRHFCDGSA